MCCPLHGTKRTLVYIIYADKIIKYHAYNSTVLAVAKRGWIIIKMYCFHGKSCADDSESSFTAEWARPLDVFALG